MKKIFTLLFMCVFAVAAKADITVYVKCDVAPFIWWWGADNGYVEKNLMTQLSQQDADDFYFQEQALLGAMWTRNPEDFWNRFSHYVDLLPTDYIPRIYQEAAYLYGTMLEIPGLDAMPFDENVKENFRNFMGQLQRYKGAPAQQLRSLLYPGYSTTYFYEYFFLKDITYF